MCVWVSSAKRAASSCCCRAEGCVTIAPEPVRGAAAPEGLGPAPAGALAPVDGEAPAPLADGAPFAGAAPTGVGVLATATIGGGACLAESELVPNSSAAASAPAPSRASAPAISQLPRSEGGVGTFASEGAGSVVRS